MFEDGRTAHDQGDHETALKIWRPLAEQGHAEAQHMLGWMYHYGRGVPQDNAEAVKWYRKAAEKGFLKAKHNLRSMNQTGQSKPHDDAGAANQSKPHDDAEAANWIRAATKQGSDTAKGGQTEIAMVGIIIGWAFGGFLYFKIAFEAAYYDGIGIIASMVLGIVLGVAVFAASGVYANVFLKYNWTPGAVPVGFGTLVAKSIIPFMIILVIFSVICRLIIFGFDDDLSKDLRVFSRYSRSNQINDDFIGFVFITFVPMFLHYLMCVWGTHKTANAR